MLHWTEYPVPVPGMIVWGAHDERYQYIVSFDSKFGTWGASAKKLGHGHLIGRKLIELGAKHRTREAALAAVEQHRRAITQ